MNSFCEQVVKRKSGLKQILITLFLCLAFISVELLFLMLFIVSFSPFWFISAFIVALTAVFTLYVAIPRINRVEYDYSVNGSAFIVDKIVNMKSRKRVFRLDIATVEEMDKIEGDNIPCYKYAKRKDLSGGALEGSYYCVYHDNNRNKNLLIFSPNEKILDGMRPSLNKDIVLKLFVKR